MPDYKQAFRIHAKGIALSYPGLGYADNPDGCPQVSGTVVLTDEAGAYLDSYQVTIKPGENYPYAFPLVFETGGRIPVNIDWHVFADGHCCIKSIPEEILLCKGGITLDWFISAQLKPYLFNQKYRELHGFFLRERAHDMEGNIAFFTDLLKTKDLLLVARVLLFVSRRSEPSRTSRCFCGSNLKYRKCHRDHYRLLSAFSNHQLDFFIKMVAASPAFSPKA